ncbi:hypothetical protein EV198_3310 [Roseivirga ehrenbergii]|uniref:Lipocalin-like domain-containing protein n=1 Tax=Roseivirga ehrenbergii (strain DSM 102268 / JCM 13514 / KCTC 12282 / NCIMB 14502 / KMM 6017) TaxID=279360 RepID=A0A150XBY5_ROSEK|nr:hypothetical protein [Roseivirga ehrenbergii]KYG76184.1 hypothetical protein MB14_02745 [Roseivirga ehrenbergii]TCL00292.1 hypothetical protein EV198_3310 [Roseivirga ehrenbergii]
MQAPKYFLVILLSFTFLMGCKNDDDSPKIKFSAEQLKAVYGNSQKSWRVTAYYTNYSNNELSDFNDCYKDDVYIFKADNQEVEVVLGELGCYWPEPDEQVATVKYFYDEPTGKFIIEHSRGETSGDLFASQYYLLELEEMSETRLLFGSGENGKYSRAIVLEAAE